MLAGGGDALGLGSVAADAITVFGAFLDTGSVPVNDPLAVLVAGGLNVLSPGIVADGTGEGAHAQLSAGVFDVAVLAAVRLLTVADFPVVDRSDVAVLGLFCLTHLGRYAVGGVRSGMAGRVDTVVEEPREAVGAALYELHKALLAVFHEADDLVQLLAVVASDSLFGVGGGCGDVQLGTGILDAGIADGDAAVADGVDRAALDGHAAAAIKARADAGSGIAARCFDGAAVDHDVHLVGVIA